MFPKPQCPTCGQTFETVAEVMAHLDESICDETMLPNRGFQVDNESRERLDDYESADPTASMLEGAG